MIGFQELFQNFKSYMIGLIHPKTLENQVSSYDQFILLGDSITEFSENQDQFGWVPALRNGMFELLLVGHFWLLFRLYSSCRCCQSWSKVCSRCLLSFIAYDTSGYNTEMVLQMLHKCMPPVTYTKVRLMVGFTLFSRCRIKMLNYLIDHLSRCEWFLLSYERQQSMRWPFYI